MGWSSTMWSIVHEYLTIPYIVEICVFIYLILTIVIGYKRKFFFALYHTIVVAVLLTIGFLVFEPIVSSSLNTSILASNERSITFIDQLTKISLSTARPSIYMNDYVATLGGDILKYLSYFIITIAVIILSPIISGLTWLFMRFLIPLAWLNVDVHWLGALLGILTSLTLVVSAYIFAGVFAPPFTYLASNAEYISVLGMQESTIYLLSALDSVYRPLLSWIGAFAGFVRIENPITGWETTSVALIQLYQDYFAFQSIA